MGNRGEDMQQRTPGRNRTRVIAIRTEPVWDAFYPVRHQGTPQYVTFYTAAIYSALKYGSEDVAEE